MHTNSQETLSTQELPQSTSKTNSQAKRSVVTWEERFLYLYLQLSVILTLLVSLATLLVLIPWSLLELTQRVLSYFHLI